MMEKPAVKCCLSWADLKGGLEYFFYMDLNGCSIIRDFGHYNNLFIVFIGSVMVIIVVSFRRNQLFYKYQSNTRYDSSIMSFIIIIIICFPVKIRTTQSL